jgi:uncharacterized membrane protein
MKSFYVVHITAGAVALLAGYLALFTSKGAPLHRRAGRVFFYTMLAMCGAGLTLTLARNTAPSINVPAALLTASLVLTGLTTLRAPTAGTRTIDGAATAITLGVGLVMVVFAFEAIANGGTRDGMPAFPFVMFGTVGLLAAAGDLRLARRGAPPAGTVRLARHLWRMTFALFIAAMSFFIGQARVIPEPIRIMPLLAVPVLVVLGALLYWMWRLRIRRSLRGLVVGGAPGATGASTALTSGDAAGSSRGFPRRVLHASRERA